MTIIYESISRRYHIVFESALGQIHLERGSNLRKVTGSVFIIFMLFLTGCTNNIDFVKEEPFVKLELYSASEGTYLDHFPKIITIADDGSVHVFTEEITTEYGEVEMKVGDDATNINKKNSEEEVKEIQQVIEENRFFSIPKDVTDYGVMDGGGSKITVYDKEKKKTVGGDNSSNKKY